VYFVIAWKSPIACRKVDVLEDARVAAGIVEAEAEDGDDVEDDAGDDGGADDAQYNVNPMRRGRRDSVVELTTTCKPRLRCRRRVKQDYKSRSVRMRYGFLFNGYETNRATDQSGIVVAWEAVVMARKLFVTLAGATISDAYLQILAALLILIFSVSAQAYFQPYEPDLLDALDTLGLLSLLSTQVLSILYLYSETAVQLPFDMGKDTLEIIVTVGLFLLNAIIIVVFASVFAGYYLAIDIRELLQCRKFKVMRLVTDKAVVAQELARPDTGREGGAAANDFDDVAVPALCWRHPVSALLGPCRLPLLLVLLL
jgi:hypothetical protein